METPGSLDALTWQRAYRRDYSPTDANPELPLD